MTLTHLSLLAILVPDYDAGIAFYSGVLGFDLLEDTDMGDGKRWVRVAPKGAQRDTSPKGAQRDTSPKGAQRDTSPKGAQRDTLPKGAQTEFLLARAVGDQTDAIGNQGGGRVWLFVRSDDFDADHARLTSKGVHFEEPPRNEPYGKVVVFRDPFGNRWDLLGPAKV